MLLNCGAGEGWRLESPLDCKEIKPGNPKGKQSWIIIGRTDAEAEAPILWPPDAKNWLVGKDPDAGKDEGRRRRGWQRMSWLGSITDSMDMNLSKLQEIVEDRGTWRAEVHRVPKSQTWLGNWTTTTIYNIIYIYICVCVHVYIYIFIYVYVYIYIYIYIVADLHDTSLLRVSHSC